VPSRCGWFGAAGVSLIIAVGFGTELLARESAQVIEYTFSVKGDGGVAPGVPLLVRVRGRDGQVIAETKTDRLGVGRLRLSSAEVLASQDVEALLDLGAGRHVGAIDTLNPDCTFYSLFLPHFETLHCHGTIEPGR
jgi:hypothetical protein